MKITPSQSSEHSKFKTEAVGDLATRTIFRVAETGMLYMKINGDGIWRMRYNQDNEFALSLDDGIIVQFHRRKYVEVERESRLDVIF